MKSLLRLSLLAALLIGLGANTYSNAQTFSAASLTGNFVFEEDGTLGVNRFLSLGLIKLDGKGGVSGYATIRNGSLDSVGTTVSGSYTVNADGTGVMTLSFSSSVTTVTDADTGESTTVKSITGSTYSFVLTSSNSLRIISTDGAKLVTAAITKQNAQ